MIGTLGSVVFSVSAGSEKEGRGLGGIRADTFRDFKRKKGASYAEHEVLGGDRRPLLEFTGLKSTTISLRMVLSAALGVHPAERLAQLGDMCDLGLAVPLIIGGDVMGLWVIETISESWDCVDSKGELVSATVDLSLKEYPDEQ